MQYIKTFCQSTVMGLFTGVAEEMSGVHIPTSKPKGDSKVPDQYKIKKRGLRNGDTSRNTEQINHLYRQVPREIRNDPVKMNGFKQNRDLGHIVSVKNGGGHQSSNTIFQDRSINRRLGKNNMSKQLIQLQRRQNHHFAKTGSDSPELTRLMNKEVDDILSKNRKSGSSGSKVKMTTNGGLGKSATTVAAKKGVNRVISHVGNSVGKVAGKTIGKGAVKLIGKTAAKKIGQKALKAIPIIGTGVAVVAGITTIVAAPYDPRSWISFASDVGTSFLGPAGVVVDIAVQTGIECF